MLAINTGCLTANEMANLIGGKMEPADFDSAAEHVDGCESCQKLAQQLDLPSLCLDEPLLRDPQGVAVQTESACQFAIHRLLDRSHVQEQTVPPIDRLGPYQILRDLGQGGMGTVCLAQHDRLKRHCAIKLLPPSRVSQPGWLDRFEREMAAVASLEHPGIVRASDAGCESGWHYLVMEYLDGLDVGRVANRVGKLSIADACEIVRQAAMALGHVHGSGLVHRDVKPSNLMLTRAGIVKLLDLGLVLPGDDPLATDDRLTTVGHLMGTLPAMSPEQLIDSRQVDTSADVYSLGATLFRLIGGKWPFASDRGIAARVLAITNQSPPVLSSVRPEVNAKLDKFVGQMLDRDPLRRPSANVVADQISQWAAEADLKTLIRHAEQMNEPANVSLASMPQPSRNESLPPIDNLYKRFTGGFWPLAWLAVGAVLATVVIQIQTKRGTVVVTTDGDDTKVEVVSNDGAIPGETKAAVPARLYLGKDFDHWMDIFQREQQIEAIGQAMRAIELLSRDTEHRSKAAMRTLELANEYGTYQVNENPDAGILGYGAPSPTPERFMGYLTEVFSNYFPLPALGAIDTTLADGNDKAKVATILVLNKYVMGVSHSANYPERQEAAKEFIANYVKTNEGKNSIDRLLMHLGEAAEAFKPNSRDSLTTDNLHESPIVYESTWARQAAWGTAVEVVSAAKGNVDPPPWIAGYVVERVDHTVALYRDRPVDPKNGETIWETSNSLRGMMMDGTIVGGTEQVVHPNWLIDGEILAAAIEMRREGRLELPTEFAVETMMHPALVWYPWPDGYAKAIEQLTKLDPKTPQYVTAQVDRILRAATTEYAETQQSRTVGSLFRADLFDVVGPIYAKNFASASDAKSRLEILQKTNQDKNETFKLMVQILNERLAKEAP
ncbi:serine/threonine protein kinase [Rubripirellula reticaptiva]|nr:serine/threonine-protein kinase [Rubripirellula reticaptiva]